jgi:iron complex transport system ATP-binding protein
MLLQCDNLSFSYAGPPVLSGVSLSLKSGEVVALLGPNGSGKSTLLRCLLGQLRAGGTVQWDGKPLARWSKRELARRVAYLAQTPGAEGIHRAIDILRMGRAPYLRSFGLESQRDIEVVEQIGHSLALTELFDRRLDELSGGQRQRVFLGRCLIQEPAALLLDEPSTFLDLRHQVELGELLRTLAKEKNLAVLMASHDLNLAGQFADRMVILHQGRIEADGPPDEVLKPELLSKVYGIPMQRLDHTGAGVHVTPIIDRKQ